MSSKLMLDHHKHQNHFCQRLDSDQKCSPWKEIIILQCHGIIITCKTTNVLIVDCVGM